MRIVPQSRARSGSVPVVLERTKSRVNRSSGRTGGVDAPCSGLKVLIGVKILVAIVTQHGRLPKGTNYVLLAQENIPSGKLEMQLLWNEEKRAKWRVTQ